MFLSQIQLEANSRKFPQEKGISKLKIPYTANELSLFRKKLSQPKSDAIVCFQVVNSILNFFDLYFYLYLGNLLS